MTQGNHGRMRQAHIAADVAIVGGGLGGIAAALAALRRGLRVVLSEQTTWLGGQLTTQLVPLDEHRRIEHDGANASYRELRDGIRNYYRAWYPLTAAARRDRYLNPGAGWVSPVCHEPKVGLAVIEAMLSPYRSSGQLQVLLEHEPVGVDVTGDVLDAVKLRSLDGTETVVEARYVLDATELGDVLPIGKVEHASGREPAAKTGEPSAEATADPLDMQGVTWCFAVDHRQGEDHTIDRPDIYDYYRSAELTAHPGTRILSFDRVAADGRTYSYQLNVNPDDDPLAIDTDHRNIGGRPELWTYRRVIARRQFAPGFYDSDITIVNWPMNDYTGGPLFGVSDAAEHWRGARELSLCLLYWLQTEAPRPDGGTGWPGLRLRPDISGTPDGLAMMPYFRESRRIEAKQTIVEQDVSSSLRGDQGAVRYPDTVGVGHYYWIDRHATTGGRHEPSGRPHPFEIPLGALIPVRARNLLPAAKNIGTTHITNGCYRLHPVEWSIGEAAGALAAFCLDNKCEPHEVHERVELVEQFQNDLGRHGVQLRWPAGALW